VSLYGLARPLLFRLDAERAHRLALGALGCGFVRPRIAADPPSLASHIFDLSFVNPVGLAAGFDKNAEAPEALLRLGFGFVELGTVTPRPQAGNPRPRLFRLPAHRALINRLGFNNKGVDYLVRRVRETPCRAVLGINIGKNFDTPVERAADDYEAGLRAVYPHAGYVTVNISSPNTPNLRTLQDRDALAGLLARLRAAREDLAQQHGRRVPLLVKLAPDLDAGPLGDIAATAREHGVDGLIATNTTIQRPDLEGEVLRGEAGGLSGAPLRPLALAALRALRRAIGAGYPLVGVGGILGGADAAERRAAGADLVQVYTGFIYRGPAVIAECSRALLDQSPALR